jgi:chaperone BCS1
MSGENSCESIIFKTYRWNAGILADILNQVKTKFRVENEGKTQFYFANNGYWDTYGSGKNKRPVSTVILSEALENKFLNDVKDFLASEDWYSERGIPYRRGYLLHGPPGCGKSSLVKAIAGELSYDICIMSLSSRSLSDDTLNSLMNQTPSNCIVVMEDIDAAFTNREEQNNNDSDEKCLKSNPAFGGTNTVTFSGLLNTLDGVASTEGRIIILTTNYVERLDPALSRPGRVDLKLHVDYPDDSQLRRMFLRFYKESSEELAQEFVTVIRDLNRSVSMAACQGLFMLHKHSGSEAIANVKQYFLEQFFEGGKTNSKIQGMYM